MIIGLRSAMRGEGEERERKRLSSRVRLISHPSDIFFFVTVNSHVVISTVFLGDVSFV
jgi:hypothetical protein